MFKSGVRISNPSLPRREKAGRPARFAEMPPSWTCASQIINPVFLTEMRNYAAAQVSGGSQSVFTPTHWSVVLAAGRTSSPDAAKALESLCREYWYPIYAFIRRRGYSPHDAEDLTQGFFENL